MRKAKELRDRTDAELKADARDLSREIFHLRNEIKTTRKAEKPHLLRFKKKERARILTLLRENAIKTSG